jgi:hypothetical protein
MRIFLSLYRQACVAERFSPRSMVMIHPVSRVFAICNNRETYCSPEPTVPCCDICDVSLLDRVRPKKQLIQTRRPKVKRGLTDKSTQARLFEWRRRILKRDHANATFSSSGILPNDLVETLASVGPAVLREVVLDDLTRDWLWRDQYFDELKSHLGSLKIGPLIEMPKKTRSTTKGTKRGPEDEPTMEAPKRTRVNVEASGTNATAITSLTDRSQVPPAGGDATSSSTDTSRPFNLFAGNNSVLLAQALARLPPEMQERAKNLNVFGS